MEKKDHLIKKLEELVNERSHLLVKDYMSKTPISIQSDQSVKDAVKLMIDHRIHGLAVLKGEKLVGVVSTFDLLLVVALDDFDGLMPIEMLIAQKPITVTSESSVRNALAIMIEKNIHRLPVMEGEKLVGMLSVTDLEVIL
ncbi:MAG: CBS domain-containing protein [Candidatus Altiarchaeota archaeon]